MITIDNVQLWVHDQEEALHFYTEKVGMEIKADMSFAQLGNFRWLTVGFPGDTGTAIVLMAIPGPPMLDDETADSVRSLMAKGATGTIFLATDDCQASYEELSGRGVEFVDKPMKMPYGIDSSFRDPSGNNIRLTQVLAFGG